MDIVNRFIKPNPLDLPATNKLANDVVAEVAGDNNSYLQGAKLTPARNESLVDSFVKTIEDNPGLQVEFNNAIDKAISDAGEEGPKISARDNNGRGWRIASAVLKFIGRVAGFVLNPIATIIATVIDFVSTTVRITKKGSIQ